MIQDSFRLCLITRAQSRPLCQYLSFLLWAVRGGLTCVQLREKSKNIDELYQWALAIKAALKPFNVPLIINDHVDLAKDIDADGVHLGQSDISPAEARKILGAHKIIGWSVETVAELEEANRSKDISYIAASAVFPSVSKSDCKTIWGLEGLHQLAQKSQHPVIAIGGIHQGNVQDVVEQGACGVAVISAIHDHQDPRQAAADLMTKINHSLGRVIHV